MAGDYIFDALKGETPQTLAKKRAIVEAMMQQDSVPRNVGEGLAGLGKALSARFAHNALKKQEAAADEAGRRAFEPVARAWASQPASAPYTTDAPSAGMTTGSTPDPSTGRVSSAADMSGNDIYSGFMDTVKSGGLTNPYGLAAVAATGKHESGFSEGNAYRQWADPSESGQAGNAGGIMSWRAERLDRLRKFAAANGGDPNKVAPQLQAQFFLQEDPNLVASLNAAKSPEEAQQMMNNAWRFAGYDRPGGEAGRRINTARTFASQFGSAQPETAPVQVASLDPSAGVAQATQPNKVAAAMVGAQAAPPLPSPRPVADMPVAQPGQQVAQAMVQQRQSGPSMQQLMEAAADPWLPEGKRRIAELMIQQQMGAQQEAQKRAYEASKTAEQRAYERSNKLDDRNWTAGREDQRFGVTDARDATRLDLERQRFEREGNKRDIISIFDEQTGRDRKGYLDQNGQFVPVGGVEAPKDDNGITVGPDGTVQIGGKSKPLTEGQAKLTLFQTLQTETQPVLNDLETQFNPANMQDAAARSTPIAGNFFTSQEGQIYKSASTAWAEGALRIATGAAATPEEMERTLGAYFAQPGDTPTTIAFKSQMREMYNRAINRSLGDTTQGSLPKPSEFMKQLQHAKKVPEGQRPTPDGEKAAPARRRATNRQTGETVEWNGSQWVPAK